MALLSAAAEILAKCPALAALSSFLFSAAGFAFLTKSHKIQGLVAKEIERSAHHGDVPSSGGLAVIGAFALCSLLSLVTSPNIEFSSVLLPAAAIAILFITGLIDDFRPLTAFQKLLGQLASAVVLIVFADIRFTNLHGFFGIFDVSDSFLPLSYAVSLFLFTLLTNAINLIDGVDGLAAGLGVICCSIFGTYFTLIDDFTYAIVAFALAGALLAYLPFNFSKRRKIFMGDSGALTLGCVLYMLVIAFCEYNLPPTTRPYYWHAAPSMSVCFLALPLFDTLRVMIIRIRHGKTPFFGDRNHVHHKLIDFGCSHIKVTTILLSVNATFIALAFLGRDWMNRYLASASIALALIYTFILQRWDKRKTLKRNNPNQ